MTSQPVPGTLMAEIQRATATIDQDGELPASARVSLHRVVEVLALDIHPEAARYVRAKLALVCAVESLAHLRDHPQLHDASVTLLRSTAATMRGELDVEVLETEYDAAKTFADDMLLSGRYSPVTAYALFAGAAAAAAVIYDTDLDGLGVEEIRTDPSDWEACFFAALAASGSATWEGSGGHRERRHFWEWYLTTAVPHAWDPETPLLGRLAEPGPR